MIFLVTVLPVMINISVREGVRVCVCVSLCACPLIPDQHRAVLLIFVGFIIDEMVLIKYMACWFSGKSQSYLM